MDKSEKQGFCAGMAAVEFVIGMAPIEVEKGDGNRCVIKGDHADIQVEMHLSGDCLPCERTEFSRGGIMIE